VSVLDKGIIQAIKNRIWAPAKSWVFQPLGANQVPNSYGTKPIKPDKAYVTILLRCMRIVHSRVGAKEFYGAVHCYVSLASFAAESGTAEFNVVTTPSQLQKVSDTNLNCVIQIDEPMAGPVPYRGGGIDIEMGLFSVMCANYVDEFLKVLVDLTSAAKASYISQAVPFVKPIDNAIHLLLGANNNNKLEVGLKMHLSESKLSESGCYAVIGASVQQLRAAGISLSGIKLDQNYQLLTQNDNPLDKYPYMIFSVESDPNRNDWCRIPEVLKAYNKFLGAIRDGNSPDMIKQIFDVFRRTARTSPDLISDDFEGIIAQVEKTQLNPALGVVKEQRANVAESISKQISDMNLVVPKEQKEGVLDAAMKQISFLHFAPQKKKQKIIDKITKQQFYETLKMPKEHQIIVNNVVKQFYNEMQKMPKKGSIPLQKLPLIELKDINLGELEHKRIKLDK